MSEDLHYQSISNLHSLLEKKIISSVELTESLIKRTQSVEPKIQALLKENIESALMDASASDVRRSKQKSIGVLDGIPIGIKDNIATLGESQSCGSKILEHYISPYQGTVSAKLRSAGAVLWGRLNMDEFAMGSSTENSAYQETSNPWDISRTPGGSSGGSAAAVAAGEVTASLGSDTGGSVRQPASFCGVVGLKPTYGLVSRYGLAAFASSLDQIGPIGRSTQDVAHVLKVIAGYDPRDSTSYKKTVPSYSECVRDLKYPCTLGVPEEYFSERLSKDVRDAITRSILFYEGQGCNIQTVSLPHMKLALPVYYIIATSEASSNLARYDGVRYTLRNKNIQNSIELFSKSRGDGFGDEVKRRVLLGTHILSGGYYDDYYLRAQKIRTLIRQDFMNAFKSVDFLVTPTTPTVAFFKKNIRSEESMSEYFADIYTVAVSLAGLPSISIPCGFSENSLPIGLQVIGKPFSDFSMLGVANRFEQAHSYYKQHPKL